MFTKNNFQGGIQMDLGGLVARNARMIPEHEGVVYEDRRYSWKIVNEKVNFSIPRRVLNDSPPPPQALPKPAPLP